MFGLNWNGSIDESDNGQGFFGYNTRDKSLHGVGLPVATLDRALGLFNGAVDRLGANIVERAPGRYAVPVILNQIKSGIFVVSVTNKNGVTDTNCLIVDVGPAHWTGNELDLTYATAHALDTKGDAKVSFAIIKRV